MSSFLCRLNDEHPDYKVALSIINELEEKEFDYDITFKTFKKYDTKLAHDNRILCFMVDMLNIKFTYANNFYENDIRMKLRKALRIIQKIENQSHPSELFNLVVAMEEILQQPDYEKLLDGLDGQDVLFSKDESVQNKAILKLGQLYSGIYEKEKIKDDIFNVYNDFYLKTISYLKQIGLYKE